MQHTATATRRKANQVALDWRLTGFGLALDWRQTGLRQAPGANAKNATCTQPGRYTRACLWLLKRLSDALIPRFRCELSGSIDVHALTGSRPVTNFLTFKKLKSMPEKKSPMSKRVKNDPEFERTRENMSEFGRVAKANTLLRSCFRELLVLGSDKDLAARLTTTLTNVIQADAVNGRGERTMGNGEFDLLRSFNFNQRSHLASTLFVREKVTVDRVTGLVTVELPAYDPSRLIVAQPATTHFALTAVAVAIDFDNNQSDHAMVTTEDIAWKPTIVPARTLQLQLPPNSTLPIFVAIGIEFSELLNAKRYMLKSGEYNASAIVHVSKPV